MLKHRVYKIVFHFAWRRPQQFNKIRVKIRVNIIIIIIKFVKTSNSKSWAIS